MPAKPDPARSRLLEAVAHHRAGRLDEAAAGYRALLAEQPSQFDALHLLGVVANQKGDHRRAVDLIERALAIRSDDASAHHNVATAYAMLGDIDAVLAHEERAVALKPDFADAQFNRGKALAELGRWAEASAAYGAVVAAKPDAAEAQWNQALARLALGDYERGWRQYEFRWRNPETASQQRSFTPPLWQGDADIAGRTVLLHAEQGLGDAIQFCRYVPLVAEAGARVVLEVPASLVRLMTTLDGVRHVVARGAALPAFDLHCPLLSLPLAFGTTLATVPRNVPYLEADASLAQRWRERLGPRTGPRIGLAWSGAAGYRDDARRSLSLQALLPHLPPGAEFVSLQKEVQPRDTGALAASKIRHFGGELADFADTAALCSQVDAVVAVDTSVAHLAGALARPTLLLLPFVAEWRWLAQRTDSPWYPTFRLLRQPARGQWDSALSQLAPQLLSMIR
jgi:hypothetical protein